MDALAPCCEKEAARSLRKHRHVATCDGCHGLVLGYGNQVDYERTIAELTEKSVTFQVGRTGKLRVVAYQR